MFSLVCVCVCVVFVMFVVGVASGCFGCFGCVLLFYCHCRLFFLFQFIVCLGLGLGGRNRTTTQVPTTNGWYNSMNHECVPGNKYTHVQMEDAQNTTTYVHVLRTVFIKHIKTHD